jgi:hypothetical protein
VCADMPTRVRNVIDNDVVQVSNEQAVPIDVKSERSTKSCTDGIKGSTGSNTGITTVAA